jgi:hypothetical protein
MMKVRDLETESTSGKAERELLKTSSQREKTLPLIGKDLRAAVEKGEGRVNAKKDLWKGSKE